MKAKIVCGILFAALALPAFARWGESYDDCVTRYGKPKVMKKDEKGLPSYAEFFAYDLVIKTYFKTEIVKKIVYYRRDGLAITPEKLFKILKAYNRPDEGLFFMPVGGGLGMEDAKAEVKEANLSRSTLYITWARQKDGISNPLLAIYNRKAHSLMVLSESDLAASSATEKDKPKPGGPGL